MEIQKYVDSLFSDYQDSQALDDFKEELKAHLDERIKSLVKKGIDEKSAFDKATGELGDISTVADDFGKKKRQEVFSEMYMRTRNYISPKKSVLYAICVLVLGMAVMFPLTTFFASGIGVASIATMLPFAMTGILGLLFLGLTQETAMRQAMSWKRAMWYVLAVALIMFGLLSSFIVYSGIEYAVLTGEVDFAAHNAPENTSMLGALAVFTIFVLPGIALGIFLVLTEKDHRKPWVKQ